MMTTARCLCCHGGRGGANIRDVVLCILSTGRLLYMIMSNINWRQSNINWRQSHIDWRQRLRKWATSYYAVALLCHALCFIGIVLLTVLCYGEYGGSFSPLSKLSTSAHQPRLHRHLATGSGLSSNTRDATLVLQNSEPVRKHSQQLVCIWHGVGGLETNSLPSP